MVDPEPVYVEGVTLVRIENGHYMLYLPDELAIGFRLSHEELRAMESFVEYARRHKKRAQEPRTMTERIGDAQTAVGDASRARGQ